MLLTHGMLSLRLSESSERTNGQPCRSALIVVVVVVVSRAPGRLLGSLSLPLPPPTLLIILAFALTTRPAAAAAAVAVAVAVAVVDVVFRVVGSSSINSC